MELTGKERDTLRKIGERYMEIALLPVQRERIDLWKSLNRGKMQRPMVVIDQLPWNELNGNDELTCTITDPYWRSVELELRKKIYGWKHFPVDSVIEPWIPVPKSIDCTGFGLKIDDEVIELTPETTAASHHYNRILKDDADIKKIVDMEFIHDEEQSARNLAEAEEIFRGIGPLNHCARIGEYGFTLSIWDYMSQVIGMEDVYYELYDNPDFIHACLRRLTDSILAGIRKANAMGIFDQNANTCHCSYIYTDELLPGVGQGRAPYSSSTWAFGMAQLFTSVSPAVFREFELPYIIEMAEQFGMIYYGCCEREDDKLDMVRNIPHVKKISCSPWSDRKTFAEKIGNTLVMSNKPNPAFVGGTSVNWDEIRSDLKQTVDLARANGTNLEIILKDISTVRDDPRRLTRWAEIAMEVVGS